MKAYWINAVDKTITEVEYTGLTDLQRMVGGYIEIAKMWPQGDVLFVDEEGMLKDASTWFRIAGKDQPLRGAGGVVVGRESRIDDGRTDDPRITLEQLALEVNFLTDEVAKAWGRANSSEPWFSIVDLDNGKRQVLVRTGQAFGVEPGRKS